MDGGIFKFVLIIIVENDAVLIHEGHDGSDPARASQKVYDDIEEPILSS